MASNRPTNKQLTAWCCASSSEIDLLDPEQVRKLIAECIRLREENERAKSILGGDISELYLMKEQLAAAAALRTDAKSVVVEVQGAASGHDCYDELTAAAKRCDATIAAYDATRQQGGETKSASMTTPCQKCGNEIPVGASIINGQCATCPAGPQPCATCGGKGKVGHGWDRVAKTYDACWTCPDCKGTKVQP